MNTLGRLAAIVVVSGLMAGCASVPSEAPKHAQTLCLPPIVKPNFLGWPIVAVRAVVGRVDTGELVPVALVRYQLNGDAVHVHWAQGRLLMVDPDPDTEAAPWIDVGALRADGSVIRSNKKACSWTRPGQPA